MGTQTNAPLFANPVAGIIHPFGWQRPAGNQDFVVTQTAAQHAAQFVPGSTTVYQAPAIDLGDGNPDADAILASIGGMVKIANTIGSANLEIDTTDPGGQRWRLLYAHDKLPHPVSIGQTVVTGQRIGTIGATGIAFGAHLHFQIGKIGANGVVVWLDPWPLLAQNRPGETDMTIIPTAGFASLVNKATAIRAGTNYRSAPILTPATVLGTTVVQVDWQPFASCTGDEANGSTTWYVGELLVPGVGHTIAFVHGSRIVSPLTPAEIVPDPALVKRVADKDAVFTQIESEAGVGLAI